MVGTFPYRGRKLFYYTVLALKARELFGNFTYILLHTYVNGGAGVGKTHLIKCIYNKASKILQNGESQMDNTCPLDKQDRDQHF
jgi:predicted ATPase